METYEDFATIDEIKQHCRVYHDEDNAELGAFFEAAIEVVESWINKKIVKTSDIADEDDLISPSIKYNRRIRAAALLITSDLYNNKESQLSYSVTENKTVELLLDGMRNIQVRFTQ